jgi:eukaryotic-like serine/threonine-protein kinase
MASDLPAKGSRPLQIGRYQVVERIATGGMGAVYLAADTKRNRKVALKVVSTDQAENRPDILQRFRAESRYGRRLNHENVVSFYRFGKHHGIYYLAMEFVDGINLEDYVKERKRLSNQQALDFMIQATRAINHLHKHGIIHRDIKPSNFIVTQQDGKERIKLIDLGLARRTPEGEPGLTQPGTTLGTVDYISPEQVRDSTAVDIRSDIYSLGCTWYHLLTGHAPFAEGTVTERIYKHMEVEPTPIRQINPDATEACWMILSRMLAKDPFHRYGGPAQLLRDLKKEFSVAHVADSRILDRLGDDAAPELEGQARRLSKGRRQFIDLEDEESDATSALFGRRKKKRKSIGAAGIAAAIAGLLVIVAIAGFFAWRAYSTP